MRFPGGAKFAFTVFDDTDVSTVANIAPVYDLLDELGFRTTKSVWMLRGDTEGSNFARSETMQDKHYREFVLDLHKRGFEIAFHGAAMESSRREDVMAALKSFAQEFGSPPNAHANHAENRDNIYWGGERFSSLPLRMLAWMMSKLRSDNDPAFSGNHPDSPYFWGDLCQQQVKYVRNFCLDNINLLNVNPSMPYHNPRKPYVNYWFSALDAPNVTSFNHLLTQSAVDRLEEQGGVCIVATHFGKFFVRDGVVDPSTQSILEYISGKNGWYVPVSELLDYMQSQAQGNGILSATELLLLELRWLIYRLRASGRDERPGWVVRD